MGKLFLNDTEMAKKTDFRHYQTLKSSIRRELTEEDCSLTVIPGNSQGKNPFSISLFSYHDGVVFKILRGATWPRGITICKWDAGILCSVYENILEFLPFHKTFRFVLTSRNVLVMIVTKGKTKDTRTTDNDQGNPQVLRSICCFENTSLQTEP